MEVHIGSTRNSIDMCPLRNDRSPSYPTLFVITAFDLKNSDTF